MKKAGAYQTFAYGADPAQAGDLYLPQKRRPPVICLFHGGFWRMPYGRDQMHQMSVALVQAGLAVWNLGYRRVGAAGGGYPGTLLDVDAGLNHLSRLAIAGADIDADRVIVAGHSAGGQLALWSAARRKSALAGVQAAVQPIAAAGLAPVCDLESTSGGGAAQQFLGGDANSAPERCAIASPISLAPIGVRQLIIHGSFDDAVPLTASKAYVETARRRGDVVDFAELPRVGHMDVIDPEGPAFARLREWLEEILA